MNNQKIKFLQAVRLLAPRDSLVFQFACRVDPDQLPEYPGAAALEFVAAFQRLAHCSRPAGRRSRASLNVPRRCRAGHNPAGPRRRRRALALDDRRHRDKPSVNTSPAYAGPDAAV